MAHNSHNGGSLIETYSLHVVQTIGSSTKNISEFGNVIEACRRLLNLNGTVRSVIIEGKLIGWLIT
jgi:hypothetical protein